MNKEVQEKIDKEFFIQNRCRLIEKMVPHSVAILGGNYPLYTNGDGVLPYVPNHDLWYFTGIKQDETFLILVKDDNDVEEILFILPYDPDVEIWDGERISPEKAALISGIDNILIASEWETVLKGKILGNGLSTLYLNLQEHPRAPFYRNRNHDLYDHCQKYFPLHKFERLSPLIHSLRMVKSPAEISEIRRATEVSRIALAKILPFLKEGYSEKDIEVEMMEVYSRHGESAFSPIVASGKNSCTLHYIVNRNELKAGEVILIDSGARAGLTGMYPADITRVFPISSKKNSKEFTPRQIQVYEAVLRVLKKTTDLIKFGVRIKDYQKESLDFVKEELLSLDLLNKKDLKNPMSHKKYFMHGVSHWLGLDVHDVGCYDGEFKEGMVLTCEPGIYIAEEGLGIRLENNFWLKSKKETENLSASIPLEIEDIYRWMKI